MIRFQMLMSTTNTSFLCTIPALDNIVLNAMGQGLSNLPSSLIDHGPAILLRLLTFIRVQFSSLLYGKGVWQITSLSQTFFSVFGYTLFACTVRALLVIC